MSVAVAADAHHRPSFRPGCSRVEVGQDRDVGPYAGGRRVHLLDCRFEAVDVPAGHEDSCTLPDDIARATGLGKGSLYGAFGDKGKLFHRVFGDWCTAVVEVAEGRPAGGPDAEALARLSGYVRLMAENTAADTERRGCLLAKGAAEPAQHIRRSPGGRPRP